MKDGGGGVGGFTRSKLCRNIKYEEKKGIAVI